uniref:FYVE-type domain-containing protein n=1 Tax=Timema genevievae TaxID=629358 RepID=A0A7R9PLE2_TIMGE|nr:unnamed protein product [Timema genevievae]
MEKFAVDLDKVLDEFEFNEDRAEQLASLFSKRSTNGVVSQIVLGPAAQQTPVPNPASRYRRAAFEPINLADADFSAAPQPSVNYFDNTSEPIDRDNSLPARGISSHAVDYNFKSEIGLSANLDTSWQQNGEPSSPAQKANISNVFSSLNEYINAGSADKKLEIKYLPSSNWIQNNLDDDSASGSDKDIDKDLSSLAHANPSKEENLKAQHLNSLIAKTLNHEDTPFPGNVIMKQPNVRLGSTLSGEPAEEWLESDSLNAEVKDALVLLDSKDLDDIGKNLSHNHLEDDMGSNEDVKFVNVSEANSQLTKLQGNTVGSHPHNINLRDPLPDGEDRQFIDQVLISEDTGMLSTDPNISLVDPDQVMEETKPLEEEKQCIDTLQEISLDTKKSGHSNDQVPIGFTTLQDISDEELQTYLQLLEEEVGEISPESVERLKTSQGSETGDDLKEIKDKSLKPKQESERRDNLIEPCPNVKEQFQDLPSVDLEDVPKSTKKPDLDNSKYRQKGDEQTEPWANKSDDNIVEPVFKLSSEETPSFSDQLKPNIPDIVDVSIIEDCGAASQSVSTLNTIPAEVGVVDSLESDLVCQPSSKGVDQLPAKQSSFASNIVSIHCQQNQVDKNISNASSKSKKDTRSDIPQHRGSTLDTQINSTESTNKDAMSSSSVCESFESLESGLTSEAYISNKESVTIHNEFENHLSDEKKVSSTFSNIVESVPHLSDGNVENTINDKISNVNTMDSETLKVAQDDVFILPQQSLYEQSLSDAAGRLVRSHKDADSIVVMGEEEKPLRPHFLHLQSKITVEEEDSGNSEESLPISVTIGPPGETPSATPHSSLSEDPHDLPAELADNLPLSSPDISECSSIEQAVSTPSLSDTLSDQLSPEERSLGKLPPFWVPDAEAPNCMLCDLKFTVLKRRHHCRACGKVLCSKCCCLKSRLEYMENSEARVCQPCFDILARVSAVEQGESASGSLTPLDETEGIEGTVLRRQPNPNNPMEYCSTIPPLEQAANSPRQPPPSVLVPVGVLKREGSARAKTDKQVMFSDGIRPGGDLTELDGSAEPRLPYRQPRRVLKRVGTPPGLPLSPSHDNPRDMPLTDPNTMSYIPAEKGLPPIATSVDGELKYEEDFGDSDRLIASLRSETDAPVLFALNRNLYIKVKILSLDCCVNRTCWCFTTVGLSSVGQDEVMVLLECLPNESVIPRDVFIHLNTLYQEATRGNTIGELGYTVFQGTPFLGSTDHGGFIYIRPSFQCLHKLVLPSAPYLIAILIHKWETPWARVFPIRLMLRLGAEFRYYPCMLVSIRQRKPVYCEIGHTIMNLLADFRNLTYTLPSVRGLTVHMEDRQTSILLPKNRYDQVMRALNNSNDHVLALAANFSQTADSHLVCIQAADEESYHTQAINIHNKPRKVTGASFVVFNGALKTSSNLTAKSSIVEDGLMVQITSDTMQELRTALRNMKDFSIGCGPAGAATPDELVSIKWVQDDKNFNVGVKSFIDGKAFDGIPSIRVHNGTDYVGSTRFVRWTEVFILQSEDVFGQSGDPVDISLLSESIARATCVALVKLLDLLSQAGLTRLAVRATIHPENVCYEAGSNGERLPPIYMNSLDNELVPTLHKAATVSPESPAAILELVFHVMVQ